MGLTEKQKLVVKAIGSCTRDESMLNDEHILEFNNILKNYSSFNMQSALLVQKPYNIILLRVRGFFDFRPLWVMHPERFIYR